MAHKGFEGERRERKFSALLRKVERRSTKFETLKDLPHDSHETQKQSSPRNTRNWSGHAAITSQLIKLACLPSALLRPNFELAGPRPVRQSDKRCWLPYTSIREWECFSSRSKTDDIWLNNREMSCWTCNVIYLYRILGTLRSTWGAHTFMYPTWN
jgi:hypothetical protein